MPVVGGRNHHGVHPRIVEQPAEVGIAAHAAADQRFRLFQPSLVALGDCDDVYVGLIAKVEHVPLADQAIADEAQADLVVGGGSNPRGKRRDSRSRCPGQKCPPPQTGWRNAQRVAAGRTIVKRTINIRRFHGDFSFAAHSKARRPPCKAKTRSTAKDS
jgi:hypothetical protein